MAETDPKVFFHPPKPTPPSASRPPVNRPSPLRQTAPPNTAEPVGLAALLPTGLLPALADSQRALWLAIGGAALLLAVFVFGKFFSALLIVVGLILWVVSPFLGAAIWKRKQGSVWVGALFGLLLGPLVLLMLLATPSTRRCPMCASLIPKVARVCGQCRQELVPSSSSVSLKPQ